MLRDPDALIDTAIADHRRRVAPARTDTDRRFRRRLWLGSRPGR